MANASVIITFVGILLAVLVVLPNLYSAIHSLLTSQSIKRKLKVNGIETLSTTSSMVAGTVEVSLPRFNITPLDREEDPDYWKANAHPSHLKGASWTLFNWNCLVALSAPVQ